MQSIVFVAKCRVLQLVRWLADVRAKLARHPVTPSQVNAKYVVEHRSKLWRTSDPREQGLELGKVQNLRVASSKLNGVTVPAHQQFSFWKQVGRATKRRGFVDGRELQEGCIVPAIGGGICQLSNALYALATKAGFEIVERHPHTQVVPGSEAEAGNDATVAWNHIDLRFRSTMEYQIQVDLTPSELVVRLVSQHPFPSDSPVKKPLLNLVQSSVGSCETCGEVGCFRHNLSDAEAARSTVECHAFVVDAVWPEFQKLLTETIGGQDVVLLPIDGANVRMDRYSWSVPDSNRKRTAVIPALRRTLHARKSLPPPARRQLTMDDTDRVARELGCSIPFTARAVTVDVGYCAELFRQGILGGREVTVWFTRFPLKLIHELLDAAALSLAESTTISDFRASDAQVDAEWTAICNAKKLVTPHPFLAQWLRSNTEVEVELIDWVLPSVSGSKTVTPGLVFFPGPTIAREGAFAVREARMSSSFDLAVGGKNLEDPSFWDGVELTPGEMSDAETVVIPAVFHNRPVVGLRAVAMGKRVIATAECGIPGAEVVPFGDVSGIIEKVCPSVRRN